MSQKKAKQLRKKFEIYSGFIKEDRDKTEYKVSYREYKKSNKNKQV